MKYVFIETIRLSSISFHKAAYQPPAAAGNVWHQRRHQINWRQRFRLCLHNVVREAFSDAKQRYEAPRLTDELRAQGYQFNVKPAASLRRQGPRAKARAGSVRSVTANMVPPVSENR